MNRAEIAGQVGLSRSATGEADDAVFKTLAARQNVRIVGFPNLRYEGPSSSQGAQLADGRAGLDSDVDHSGIQLGRNLRDAVNAGAGREPGSTRFRRQAGTLIPTMLNSRGNGATRAFPPVGLGRPSKPGGYRGLTRDQWLGYRQGGKSNRNAIFESCKLVRSDRKRPWIWCREIR